MKLLIIDDEPHIRHMMRLTLEDAGYTVDEAPSGQAGLDRFGDGREYDAILLDQRMPGLDGLETLREMKKRRPGVCVLMVTAFASIELAVDVMRLGATDFLRKPMTPETLRGAVAAAIAGRTPERSGSETAAASAAGPIDITVLTMNGFQIRRVPHSPNSPSAEHAFRLKHVADGAEVTVIVSIDPDAVDRVARLTHRRLAPDGAFWKLQAERLLSTYVWSEGHGPTDGRLAVRDISNDDLDAAARWDDT
jgi:CheY-like chemotaxis protein